MWLGVHGSVKTACGGHQASGSTGDQELAEGFDRGFGRDGANDRRVERNLLVLDTREEIAAGLTGYDGVGGAHPMPGKNGRIVGNCRVSRSSLSDGLCRLREEPAPDERNHRWWFSMGGFGL